MATLLTYELMKLIKLSGMFPAVEHGLKCARLRSHQLSTSKPHLGAQGSYLRAERAVKGLLGKIFNAKISDLLFHKPTGVKVNGFRFCGHLVKQSEHLLFEELPILILGFEVLPQSVTITLDLIGNQSRGRKPSWQ